MNNSNIIWSPSLKIGLVEKDFLFKVPMLKMKKRVKPEDLKKILNSSNSVLVNLLIKEKLMMNADQISQFDKEGIDHWKKRKWIPSLDYYLFSRNIDYLDEYDGTGHQRKELRTILNERKRPSMKKIDSIFEIDLTEEKPLNISTNVYKSLNFRRSVRKFDMTKPVSFSEFSYILIEGINKIKRTRELELRENNPLRSYGSAFSFYIAVFNVVDVPNGIYEFDIDNKKIRCISEQNYISKLPSLMGNQPFVETAAFTLFIVADFMLYQWRYRHEKALRQLYIEAGRSMQHIHFKSIVLDIQGVPTPALFDTKLGDLLKLNIERELPIYSLTLGKRHEV